MDGVCIFEEEPEGEYIFGGPVYRGSSNIPLLLFLCPEQDSNLHILAYTSP